jgi:hypothetical protein
MVAKKIKPVPDDVGENIGVKLSAKPVKRVKGLSFKDLSEITELDESFYWSDDVYNSLVGDSPFTFSVSVPFQFKQLFDSYRLTYPLDESNNFNLLVHLIVNTSLDRVYYHSFKRMFGEFVNASLSRSLKDFPSDFRAYVQNSLNLPLLAESSRLKHYMDFALSDYKEFQRWLFDDASASNLSLRHDWLYDEPTYSSRLSAVDLASENLALRNQVKELQEQIETLKLSPGYSGLNEISDNAVYSGSNDNQDSDHNKMIDQYPDESDNEYIDRVEHIDDSKPAFSDLSYHSPPLKRSLYPKYKRGESLSDYDKRLADYKKKYRL